MLAYRLVQKKFAETPFSTKGSKLTGGRWNSVGTGAIYMADSESLSTLEVFVHCEDLKNIRLQYDLYRVQIPDHLIANLEEEDLPPCWCQKPHSAETKAIGDEFLSFRDPAFAALSVPSAISPRDKVLILSPFHAFARTLDRESEKLDFEFDYRMLPN